MANVNNRIVKPIIRALTIGYMIPKKSFFGNKKGRGAINDTK